MTRDDTNPARVNQHLHSVSLSSVMEVYEFTHDASMCEVWLNEQESLIGDMAIEECSSVSHVEQLQRQLDVLHKSAGNPWQQRFAALEKLTEVSGDRWTNLCMCVVITAIRIFNKSNGFK